MSRDRSLSTITIRVTAFSSLSLCVALACGCGMGQSQVPLLPVSGVVKIGGNPMPMGTVEFHPDLYGRDAPVLKRLEAPFRLDPGLKLQ